MRRFVLLGASNLTMGFPRIHRALETAHDGPLEIFAALGHGRSYGMWSRILHRELPGIKQCGLWGALEARPTRPERPGHTGYPGHDATFALLTDVGNDLLYGAEVEQIADWVGECLRRLNALGACTVITELPMGSLQKLSAWRYYAARTLLFPTCRITWGQIRDRATRLNQRLWQIGEREGVRLVEQPGRWYGVDPIHFRHRRRAEAWRTILSAWPEFPPDVATARAPLGKHLEYFRMQPALRRVWGRERVTPQPVLENGRVTVAFY